MDIKFNNEKTLLKRGSKIHIKESTKGSFTKYCKGKVTQDCIDKAKRSGNKKLIKKAVFAENSRKWSKKHQEGGTVLEKYSNLLNNQNKQLLDYNEEEKKKKAVTEALHQQQLEEARKKGNTIGTFIGRGLGAAANILATPEEEEEDVDEMAQERVDEIQVDINNQVKSANAKFNADVKKEFNSTFKLPTIPHGDNLLANDFLEIITKQHTV